MTAAVIPAVEFEAPLVNPSPQGLYPITTWTEVAGPSRFLGEGVRIRPHNYGGADAFGVWDATWCAEPGEITKEGTRPDPLDPFAPVVVWAVDQCDLTSPSQAEVRERAAQNLRLLEQTAVEAAFAERLLDDIDTSSTVGNVAQAVSYLEAMLAITNTTGFIHAPAKLAAEAAQSQLIVRSGTSLKTPLGHTWVFGGGYEQGGLDEYLVATSQPFGWRSEPTVRDTIEARYNQYVAVAERAVVVGYEALIGAAVID